MKAEHTPARSAPDAIAWWRRAPISLGEAGTPTPEGTTRRYRFGDGTLALASADRAFAQRFHALFEECEGSAPDAARPLVTCRVEVGTGGRVRAELGGTPDLREFLPAMFADRGLAVLDRNEDWVAVGSEGAPEDAVVAGRSVLLLPGGGAWQRLLGSLLVCAVQAQQPDVLFLHAGAVGIGDGGLLLVGPKESGKTTLSLGLAARGHVLLGDEMAGVRRAPLEILPVRRSCAIREGPRHRLVEAALAAAPGARERFPDGTVRWRVAPRALFPAVPAPPSRPLRWVVFLEGRGPTPALEPVAPTRALLGRLTPLRSSIWCRTPQGLTLDLLAIVGGAACARLRVGPPEDTVTAIETFLEQPWS